MKNKIFTSCIALGMLVVTNIAAAAPITGDLFFGGMSTTTTDASGITSIAFQSSFALAGTDDFSGINPGTLLSITDLTTIAQKDSFWSVGGFTFDLLNITSNYLTDDGANLVGTGIISAAGYEDTFYTWAYSTQTIGENSLSSFSANAVPAPAGVAFLGLGLLGFAAVRRNKKA